METLNGLLVILFSILISALYKTFFKHIFIDNWPCQLLRSNYHLKFWKFFILPFKKPKGIFIIIIKKGFQQSNFLLNPIDRHVFLIFQYGSFHKEIHSKNLNSLNAY